MNRRRTGLRTLLERAVERSAAERRLRGLTIDLDVPSIAPEQIWGDEELLSSAFGALALATAMLIDSPHGSVVTLRASRSGDDAYTVTAVHGAELPHHWRTRLADDAPESIGRAGDVLAAAVVLLRAAKRIAELHGGHMTLDCADGRTDVSVNVPIGRQ
jgi:hypothetical protein